MNWGQRFAGRSHGRPAKGWWAVAGALLVIATGSFAVGLRGGPRSLPGPVAATAAPGPVTATTVAVTPSVTPSASAPAPGVASPVAVRSVPVALRIPAIGVAASLSLLGLNPDGTVQVPTNFALPGWFRLGPTPGQMGSAVILGHVDSHRGPAVFFRLRYLRAGDRVEVSLTDGMVAHFVVTKVAMYPKDQFPARQVYGSHGHSALQLVTCGGTFDPHSHSYLSNVVAYTSLVGTTPAGPDQATAAPGPAG